MKVGILPRHFNDWPIEKVLKYVSGLGYEAVEVHAWIQYGNRFADSRHINVEEILGGKATEYKRLYDQNNLIISALTDHVSTSYVLDPDESIAKKAKKRTKQLVEAAALLDVPYIVGFCGDPHWGSWYGWPPATEIWEAAWKEYKEVWGELLDHFGKYGIKFALETHGGGCLAYNVETTQRAIKEVGERNELGINFDPSQMLWQGLDPATFIYEFADRIIHVHAKDQEKNPRIQLSKMGYLTSTDARRKGMGGFRDRVPGWGDVNWKKMITALGEVGYDGVLSFEFNSDPLFNREEATERAIAFLKPLIPKA